jgi:hypothetical protein
METKLKFEYETFNDAHNVYSILILAFGYDGVEMDYDLNTVNVYFKQMDSEIMRKLERVVDLLRDLGIKAVAPNEEVL